MVGFTVPNVFGTYQESFQQGRAQAKDARVQNALQLAGSNPEAAQAALMQVGAFQEANQLGQVQTQRKRDAGAARARDLYGKGDRSGAMQEAVFSGNSELASGLKALDDERLQQMDRRAQKLGGIAFNLGQIADPNQRQQVGTKALEVLVQQGEYTPAQAQEIMARGFGDDVVKSYVGDALGLKEAIDREMGERKFKAERGDADRNYSLNVDQFSETKRTHGVQEGFERQRIGLEGQRVALARASEARQASQSAGGMTPQQARQQSMAIRKEFNGLPDVKAFNDVATSYDIISTLAAATPSAANDMSLIFSYMKMLDPGSVVREGEFANAQNAAGIPDRVRNAYNKAMTGQMLNPKQRGEFTQGASNVYTARRGRYDQVAKEYQSYASDIGLSGETLIQPRPAPARPPSTPAQPQRQGGGLLGQAGRALSRPAQQSRVIQYDAQGNPK